MDMDRLMKGSTVLKNMSASTNDDQPPCGTTALSLLPSVNATIADRGKFRCAYIFRLAVYIALPRNLFIAGVILPNMNDFLRIS